MSGIINYCADGIIIIDSQGNIEQVNPACENMVGLSAEALTKMKIQEIAFSDNPKMNKAPKSSVKKHNFRFVLWKFWIFVERFVFEKFY